MAVDRNSGGCFFILLLIISLGLGLLVISGPAVGNVFSNVIEVAPPAAEPPVAAVAVAVPQSRTEDGAFVIGNPDAPVTIIEFADFLCPACQRYHEEIGRWISDYVLTGQARFEFRMLPTQQLSPFVFAVAECAAEQSASGFWPVHEALFDIANTNGIGDDVGRIIADRFDLDYAGLLECTQEADQFEIDRQYASSLGVGATPSIRVRYGDGEAEVIDAFTAGGVPYDVLAQVVEEANR